MGTGVIKVSLRSSGKIEVDRQRLKRYRSGLVRDGAQSLITDTGPLVFFSCFIARARSSHEKVKG
jgi:hypothetical protein